VITIFVHRNGVTEQATSIDRAWLHLGTSRSIVELRDHCPRNSKIFMPLTLLAGLWGVNVPLPRFPRSDTAQFWWLCGISLVVIVAMLAMFRRKRWI
jgi:CorA-like Mg2+ transporter protein